MDNTEAFPGSYGNSGMTLRDWFAGQALTGGLANPNRVGGFNANGMAKACYEAADAMMEARKA